MGWPGWWGVHSSKTNCAMLYPEDGVNPISLEVVYWMTSRVYPALPRQKIHIYRERGRSIMMSSINRFFSFHFSLPSFLMSCFSPTPFFLPPALFYFILWPWHHTLLAFHPPLLPTCCRRPWCRCWRPHNQIHNQIHNQNHNQILVFLLHSHPPTSSLVYSLTG